jgi:hypothetical protein
VRRAAWADPFVEPLDESDRAHVDRYSRWSANDITARMATAGWRAGPFSK